MIDARRLEAIVASSLPKIPAIDDWKALESFAEYAAWRPGSLTRTLSQLIDRAPGRVWHGFRISAVDDTKVHRSGEHVWGTCTSREYTARCPNRAITVRAHNWVCLGSLLENDIACVEGYKKRFTRVSSAAGLSRLELVELFAARFRQEDGFRDLKRRLGWEECRAWTHKPIERTGQVQWITMSLRGQIWACRPARRA